MSRPRRRLFGPLLYSTLVAGLLAATYAAFLQARPMLERIDERRQVAALAGSLRAADPSARESAANLLVSRWAGAARPILRDAARDPRGEVRALACRSLVRAGGEPSEMVPMLVAAAGDEREDVRVEAARGLGQVRRERAILGGARATSGVWTPALRDEALRAARRLLKDRSPSVRAEAAGTLVELGPGPSIAADLAAAAEDEDRAVRLAAARALARLNGPDDPTAARTLVAMAASPVAVPDRPEVLRAVATMGAAVQDRAVAALVDLASRGDPAIAFDVLACLPDVGPRARAAVPALERLLDHADPGVRASAGLAIAAIETSGALPHPEGGLAAGMGLMAGMMARPGGAGPAPEGPASPRAVAALVRIVADAEVPRDLRENALAMARGIDETAPAKASADLIRQLADPDPVVRRAAADFLSQIIDAAPAELPSASGP